jgi:hypothetical protein
LIDQHSLIYTGCAGQPGLVGGDEKDSFSVGEETVRDEVRRRYAAAALSGREVVGSSSCCGSDTGLDSEAVGVDFTGGSYSEVEKRELPRAAVEASLGCGNPVALATLSPGEVILDLGSGEGSTSCSRRGGSRPAVRPTAWT